MGIRGGFQYAAQSRYRDEKGSAADVPRLAVFTVIRLSKAPN